MLTREEAKKHYEKLYAAKIALWEIEHHDAVEAYDADPHGDADAIGIVDCWIKAHVEDAMLEWDRRNKYDRECDLVKMRDSILKRHEDTTAELARVQKRLDETLDELAWQRCKKEEPKP